MKTEKKSFLSEVKTELKKVSWTSKQELLLSTKVVIYSTFIFGFGIYFSDLGMKSLLDGLALVFRRIFG
jgi:preprotein translocase subunit SecE